jgi:uncharacterized membrane protein (DUF441 family)
MNFDLSVITTNAIVIVPIVIALVQAVKLTGFVPDHFSPILAIVIGIIIGWLGDHDNPDLTVTLLSGAVYGLMASGLYSGVKTTMVAHQRMKARQGQKSKENKCR